MSAPTFTAAELQANIKLVSGQLEAALAAPQSERKLAEDAFIATLVGVSLYLGDW